MAVARATGVVMAAAAEAGVPVEEYGSLEVKNAITGSGGADKAQIHTALVRIHGLADVPTQPDARRRGGDRGHAPGALAVRGGRAARAEAR